MDRRTFLKEVAVFSTALSTPTFFLRSAEALGGSNHRSLVVIELVGGSDGLNTVIPYRNPDYYAARPNLAIPAKNVLKMTDTFGFRILGRREVVYIPDIDDLREEEAKIIRAADAALIDGSFYTEDELSGRSVRDVPHPLIPDSMEILGRPANEIHFTHFNHTNEAAEPGSTAANEVIARGFGLAYDGMRIEL